MAKRAAGGASDRDNHQAGFHLRMDRAEISAIHGGGDGQFATFPAAQDRGIPASVIAGGVMSYHPAYVERHAATLWKWEVHAASNRRPRLTSGCCCWPLLLAATAADGLRFEL